MAAGALNESGAVSLDIGGRRLYPIQVAEKGYAVYRIAVRGTWGHGSMPRPDNAVVLASEVVRRLSEAGSRAPDTGHGGVLLGGGERGRRRGRDDPPRPRR